MHPSKPFEPPVNPAADNRPRDAAHYRTARSTRQHGPKPVVTSFLKIAHPLTRVPLGVCDDRRSKAAYLIMLRPIVERFLSGSYGPLDRLLEIGVFVLIAYEVVVGICKRYKERKRRSYLDKMLAALSGFMKKGQQVRQSIPRPLSSQADEIQSWMASARVWSTETTEFLDHHSPRASVAFSLIVEAEKADTVVHPKEGEPFHVGGQFRERYQILLVQLDNLRQITRNPEAYF